MGLGSELQVMVSEAPARTVAARTARVLHGVRVGAADGAPARTERPEAGVVDFEHGLVFYASTIVVRAGEYPGETLWEGPNSYSRESESQEWTKLPMFGRHPGAMPFGAPLWLLNALCGARGDVTSVGEERVREITATRIRMSVDREIAGECSPCDLDFPGQEADAFPAEVWLDAEGRVRRMGCTWPLAAPSGFFWSVVERVGRTLFPRRSSWTTTEFWEFGADVAIPKPPSASGS